MLKKLISLVLAAVLLLAVTAAAAETKEVSFSGARDIQINEAGLNPPADEMIAQGISPTTGRKLESIEVP